MAIILERRKTPVRIKCSRCGGVVWEEKLHDHPNNIDLVCLICGKRSFYDRKKYLKAVQRILDGRKKGTSTR